jgi:alpha-beta hydrolase superfamily lysophospholipase
VTDAKPPYQLRAGDMPAHLQQAKGSFKGPRGQQLAYVALFPPAAQRLRGVVLWLHGIGEHAQRYYALFARLCAAGFGVAAYDLLGHGESDSCEHGLRAHGARFQYFVDDTNAFVAMAKRDVIPKMLGLPTNEPGKETQETEAALPPLLLGGMSYGTRVGLHTALAGVHTFRALFLVAPAVSVEMTPVLRVQSWVSKPLSLLLPKARIVPGVNRDFVCRDPAFNADFDADPLTTTEPMTSRMGEQSLSAMLALQADARVEQADSAFCQLPVLFLMGAADKVTSVPLAQAFYARLANADKEFVLLDGFYHDLFNDPEREKALAALIDWLHLRFPEPSDVQ